MKTRETTGEVTRRHDSINMLEGPLLGKILAFALPLALASLLQQLFNTADAALAGRLIANEALAAIGATSPVISLLVNLFVGLSVGANVTIAICIGQQHPERIRQAVHTSVALALASGGILLALGMLLARPMLELIGTPADVLSDAVLYLRIYFIGMPFSMIYNFGSAILRSKGDSRRPLYALAVGCLANVLLDVVVVTVLNWGIAGIAGATALANAIDAAIVLAFLVHEEPDFRLDLGQLRFNRPALVSVLKVGIPAGLQGAVFAVSNVVIQSAINGFGPEAMAGSAASLNFELFTFFVISAFGSAAVTFTSQNYAANNPGRCMKIFAICMACGTLISAATVALFCGFDRQFIGLFTADAAALGYGLARLWQVELFEFVCSIYEIPAGALRGMGHSMLPAVLTIIGTCVVRIVWVYTVFAASHDFDTLMLVYPVTWVITGVAMLVSYFIIGRTLLAHRRRAR